MNARLQFLIAVSVLLLVAATALAGRVPVPAPPGGGEGVRVLATDQQHVLDLPPPEPLSPPRPPRPAPPAADEMRGNIGGDDVEMNRVAYTIHNDLAVASDGTLFSAWVWAPEPGDDTRLTVMRSTDGGTTWDQWAELHDPAPDHGYRSVEIRVAEGLADRVFLAYTFDPGDGHASELHVAWSPLDQASGDFSHDTLLHSGTRVASYGFTTDADIFSSYYTYLVYSAWDIGSGADIHFARSINQGDSWESPYVLAEISVSDRGYYAPSVAIGQGGWVHVAWYLGFADDHEFDDCLRYRRAPDYASGGLGDWENMQSLTSHLNGIDDLVPVLGASPTGGEALIASLYRPRNGGDPYYDGLEVRASTDAGATWGAPTRLGDDYINVGEVVRQESTTRWLMSVAEDGGVGFRWAPVASPTSWSALQDFADLYCGYTEPGLVVDPTQGGRIGVAGANGSYGDYGWFFDAEWRTDPGYPVTEFGFPVNLTAEPISDPAVVDLDGDGDLEIVFGDDAGRIQVYRCTGTPLPGWPRDTGHALSDSPIAVGDLNGDGVPWLFAGTTDGLILAYTPDGSTPPGWPHDTGYDDPVYLAIGAIGGPYPRALIWGCGPRLYALDHHGTPYPEVLGRGFESRTFSHPPAIGDLNGDGRADVVMSITDDVFAFRLQDSGTLLARDFPADVSAPITLADFDADGDVEVVVPLASGDLHLIEHDGSEFPGAWPVTVDDSWLTGTAIANCLGNWTPEIAVAAHDWLVSVYFDDGDQGTGWPVDPDGWYVYGQPIVGNVGGSPDVMLGARGRKGWTWSNFGEVNPGWPLALGSHCYRTPATGDLDLDGNSEIVFLSTDALTVVDVRVPPDNAHSTWAMAGHDPERSGCADCPLDLVPVVDDADRVTRVSLAAPHPNPVAGAASFAFAVPVRARVELAVYDVRGHRVALITREEVSAGRHAVTWRGRDRDGRPLASGQYLARLSVQGPGLDQQLTRKLTVLR